MDKKIVIGLCSRHDGSYVVLEDGIIVEHIEIERYTRIKESGGNSWKYFCERYLEPQNVSVRQALKEYDFVAPMPTTSVTHCAHKRYELPKDIKINFYSHHLCHAANAYFSSPYDEAISISIDNAGMDDENKAVSCTVYLCKGNHMKRIFDIPHNSLSLGNLWGRLTRFVFKLWSGYPRGHQAGTVMAMAALGNPEKYLKDLQRMMGEDHNKAIMSPPGMKRGVYVPPEEEVEHPYLAKWRKIAEEDEQEKYNIAAALQRVTEDFLQGLVEKAVDLAQKQGFAGKNICFSGGCALNSVSMGKIWKRLPEGWSMFVPPIPYDGGLSVGAAQYHYHCILGNKKTYPEVFCSPYLGEDWTHEIDPTVERYTDQVEVKQGVETKEVAQYLADGKIVAFYNGRSESGRRALGNRSILANPGIANMKQIINDRVKHRQWYRPFAPSVMEEYGHEWFDKFFPSPYMGFVFDIKKDKLGKAEAIEHLDGSARIQSVSAEQNPAYYELIKEFHDITGLPLVLNTSFNDREPIVETPEDAIKCFIGTDIDYLYYYDQQLLIEKK